MRRLLPVLVLCLVPLTGCWAMPMTTTPAFAAILTEDVVIEDEQGMFSLSNEGDPVGPPFRNKWLEFDLDDGQILERYADAIRAGARRVRVTVPGAKKPLYGVLALSPVAMTKDNKAEQRAYRIAIPADRVEQAQGGRVSVVYQPYTWKRGFWILWGQKFYECTRASWFLWLSDVPFPEVKMPQVTEGK